MRLRVLSLLFVGVLSAGLNACDGGGEDASGGGTGGSATTGGGGGEGPTTGGRDGSGGGTGGASGGTGGATMLPTYPASLHASGLYEGDEGETLAEGVREFTPRFALYSDGATKRRWIQLPPGTQIDTSDPDYWVFPTGTKLWKEFSRDGTRVETRYLEKRANGSFWRIAYQWNDEQSAALPVPDGVENASGTPHDIPSRDSCMGCHTRTRGEVLGFSALQLAYASDTLDLADLIDEDLLTDTDALDAEVTLPGTQLDQDALGYLHVNCGTCHNPTSSVQARVDLDLRLRLGLLTSVAETPVDTTAFGVDISVADGTQVPGATKRIVPGDSGQSAVFLRMDSRGETYSMPSLGTEEIDVAGSDLIADWIDSLD